jgi:hypothetical protein
MKSAWKLCAILFLASTLVAQTSTAPKPKKAKPAPVTAADVQALKDALASQQSALAAQQQQIQALQDELRRKDQAVQQAQTTATDASGKADAAQSQASQQQQAVGELKTEVGDLKTTVGNTVVTLQEAQKSVSPSSPLGKEVSSLSKIKFSGDLRLRYEPFFGGGPANGAASPDRHRERYRLRFNVNSMVTPDFAVGFSLASGDPGDPISTNSTETGFYTRKFFAVDKAFGTYNPHYFKPFAVTVGKFGYTWQRTELTWDNDLNPEGASEQVAWNWKDKFLNHVAFIGFETPIFEVGGGPDTYMTGGQVQTGWTLGPRIKLALDTAYYDFANADTIAQNQTGGNGSATSGTTTAGGGTYGFGGSTDTNNFDVINSKRVFASKFGILDALARLDFDTGSKRWPIYVLFDFAQNTRACANLQAFVVAGVTPPACDPHQRHGYWSELKLGQTKDKGDLLVGYTFARIERDAVLSAFNFSDLRQATNVIEHRVEAYYQAYPHVQVGATGLIGRQIVTAQSPTLERWLKRWQFDTIFSF